MSDDADVDFEDVLVVPPSSVQDVRTELANARFIPMRWHQEGRYGLRIRPFVADGIQYRAIPILPHAAARIKHFLEALSGVVDEEAAGLPMPLRQLLQESDVRLQRVPRAMLKHVKEASAQVDHTVHGDRAAETVRPDAPSQSSFTFAELFAGVGGFRLGLEALGGRCVFASEIERWPVNVCKMNFGDSPSIAGDIIQVPDEMIPPHDVLVGGFPCQPFSSLGDQPGLYDEKGNLFLQIIRILRLRKPSAFLLENVPGLVDCDGGRAFGVIVAALEGEGYTVHHEVLNAVCLTPQSRNRLYIVGLRKDSSQSSGDSDKTFCFPFIPDLGLRAGDVFETDSDVVASGHAEDFTLSDEQLQRLQNSENWQRNGGLTKTMVWEDKSFNTLISHYAVSITKGNSQLVARPPPHNPRRFTPRECARLMGFPDTFALPPYDSAEPVTKWFRRMYRMLGNAVCPPMIAALGGAILAHCPEISKPTPVHDWADYGRGVAVRLALAAVAPQKRESLISRLHSSWKQEDNFANLSVHEKS